MCTLHLDDEGVVTNLYHRGPNYPVHNPTTIGVFSLSNFNHYVHTGNRESRRLFRANTEWLKRSIVEGNSSGLVYARFRFVSGGYLCENPWTSVMHQGLAISALIRLSMMDEDEEALEAARKAFQPYLRDVPEGVASHDDHGHLWLEEYAGCGTGHVLNGFLYGLVGARELLNHTGDPTIRQVWREGLRTLTAHLGDFEVNLGIIRWSRYDDERMFFSGSKYHSIHIAQLDWLSRQSREVVFTQTARRWQEYEERYGSTLRKRLIEGLHFVMWRMS